MLEHRVLVLGAGAIGGVIAARLTGRLRRVAVLGSDHPRTSRLRDPGLELQRDGVVRRIALEAYRSAAELPGEFDYCLVAVKAPALAEALTPLAARDGIDTFVSLGNGLVQDRISAVVGAQRLIAGTVEWGATNLGDGRVRQTSENPIVVGELDGAVRARTRALVRALSPAAEVRITDNIAGALWSKLVLNSALSGMSTVGGCDCAGVLDHPDGRHALCELWAESYGLGVRQGLALEPILGMHPGAPASRNPGVARRALDRLAEQSGPTRASMLQDIERGRLTEVDVINGAVVDLARTLGVDAPRNQRVRELVHSFERGERSPSRELFGGLTQVSG